MNNYEQRQEARRVRLEKAAERAQAESASRFQRMNEMQDSIPLGQPILVGHHSEKRHRRDLARIDANMRRGVEAEPPRRGRHDGAIPRSAGGESNARALVRRRLVSATPATPATPAPRSREETLAMRAGYAERMRHEGFHTDAAISETVRIAFPLPREPRVVTAQDSNFTQLRDLAMEAREALRSVERPSCDNVGFNPLYYPLLFLCAQVETTLRSVLRSAHADMADEQAATARWFAEARHAIGDHPYEETTAT